MVENEEDFATLFEASIKTKRYRNGQTIEGTIVAISADVAFINVGGKGEATIDLDELKDDEGDVEVAVGDRIKAVVVSTAGGLTLSRKLALGAVSREQLEGAFRSSLPVEGKVEEVVKGGYEVRIARQRAFCPMSQIDTVRHTDPTVHLGRVYPFRIIEFKEDGRNLIVSRRVLLEAEQQVRAVEVRKSIVVDAILTGQVVSVRDFGAFVDLGAGVQGLLHVSEMSWSRVSNPAEFVEPGQEVTVKVLRVDDQTQQIALGLKQLAGDPWSVVPATYDVGQVRDGRITRVADFGAFVELAPGIEGLAHVSTFPPTGQSGGWSRLVSVGMTGAFEILSIDLDKKRIGVALVEERARTVSAGSPPESSRSALAQGSRVTGKVERHETFGVFVFLAPGRTGLMPLSETGLDRGADVKKAFPVGSELDVIVLETDSAGRRIRVSCKAVKAAMEAAEVREYAQREEAAQTQSFGSLADKLRGAMGSTHK